MDSSNAPRPADSARTACAGGAADAARRPAQRPLDLEPDHNEGVTAPAKKLSS